MDNPERLPAMLDPGGEDDTFADDAPATEEQLEEARVVFEQLVAELNTYVVERARFRSDLAKAVADGEEMIRSLRRT